MSIAPSLAGEDVGKLRLSEIVSALSYALDITEGEPEGHAVRTCLIGMRIAKEVYLLPKQRSALFYALLLKDLGCSSNASRVCTLFGVDDRQAKCDLKTSNWTSMAGKIGYLIRNVSPGAGLRARIARFMRVARMGAVAARELVEMRCDRGASIARGLLLPEETAGAIANLDEHWDGMGFPHNLRGEDIPMAARIAGLAQTMEVFFRRDGMEGALKIAQERAGTWFDPELVKIALSLRGETPFWATLHMKGDALKAAAMRCEPEEIAVQATEEILDRLATGFGQVIDAKSPWTYRHSEGVAEVAVGIGEAMGMGAPDLRLLRRAARLHDIGKLGISNLILDKPGKLDAAELAIVRKHPAYTREILSRVSGFAGLADVAAAHHERVDGAGYDRGIPSGELPVEARILTMADMFEALASRRPYREDLTEEQVMDILVKSVGTAVDGACFEALKVFLAKSEWEPVELAA